MDCVVVYSGGLCITRESRVDRLQREIHRLRTSPSLRLGAHLTDAIRKPWRAPFLIITLPIHMLMIGFELLGLKPQPQSLSTNSAGRLTSKGDCIVMFPTNGVGFDDDYFHKRAEGKKYSCQGTKGEEGSGYGITIVEELMKLHKGEFNIASKKDNGTTITLGFDIYNV